MKDFEKMAAMGVPEIDYVLNQKAVESRDFETIEKEMVQIIIHLDWDKELEV